MPLLVSFPMASDWSSIPQGGDPNAGSAEEHDHGIGSMYGRIQTSAVDRPPLRSHKSFPYSLGTSNFASPHAQSPLTQGAHTGFGDTIPGSSVADLKEEDPAEISVQMSFGGSAPVSPVPQLTPTSVDDGSKELPEATEYMEGKEEEDEEQIKEEIPREQTAAEKRAERRKMKRFRLTHNQTRFLMSEFARQAHPDAAQRERLSREIPGLSPRQVQVWFQNRRAKLKRLTTDDRERIMKSRALPDDFDLTTTLQSPFTAGTSSPFQPQPHSTPLESPAGYTPYDTTPLRMPNIGGLRRESEDDNTSPISMPSAYGQFFTPPASVTTSETMSPVSPSNDRAPFMAPSYAQPSPRTPSLWANRSSNYANYQAPISTPRLQLHDRIGRSRAESIASPLRTSMSYTGYLDQTSTTTETAPSLPGSATQPPREYWPDMPVAQSATGYNALGFPSTTLSRQGPITTTFPPGLNLQPQTRSLQPASLLQQARALQQESASRQQQSTLPAFPGMSQGSNLPAETSQASEALFYSTPTQPQVDMSVSGGGAEQAIYGGQYPDAENDTISTFGTSSVASVMSEPAGGVTIEPESYYKSEPYGNRIAGGSVAGGVGSIVGYAGSRPHSSSFGASMVPHQSTTNPLARAAQHQHQQQQHQHQQQQAQQQQQQSQRSPTSPFGAGTKRRRDSLEAGSEPDMDTGEYHGGSRKRSYTMPSGYRGGLGL